VIAAVAYWTFGIVLGGAIATGIGRPLVAERGQKVIPPLAICGLLLGLGLGWAINVYVAYVRASAALHP
jgi:hypothetical protein